jgi:hypothetical protein
MESMRGPAHPDTVTLRVELADALAIQRPATSGR